MIAVYSALSLQKVQDQAGEPCRRAEVGSVGRSGQHDEATLR